MYCILYTSSENYDNQIYYTDADEDITNKQCLICWVYSIDNNPIQTMQSISNIVTICKCNPLFHYKCIKDWVNRTSSCPICRKKITFNSTTITNNNSINIVTNIIRFTTIVSFVNIVLLFIYYLYLHFNIKQEYFDNYY
jgi:hypothetical protein